MVMGTLSMLVHKGDCAWLAVAHQIVIASVPEFRPYEFGRVNRPFTTLPRILEEVGAAGLTVLTAAAKRSRAPRMSDAAGYFGAVVERLVR